jgi:hypothetical protein
MNLIRWLRRFFGVGAALDDWSVATGDEKGHPVIVRTRTRAPRGIVLEQYPASVEVTWSFDGSNTNGMPTPELQARMSECEDLLATLESSSNGLLGMSITGNGRREWIWYVANADDLASKVQGLVKQRFPVGVRIGPTA